MYMDDKIVIEILARETAHDLFMRAQDALRNTNRLVVISIKRSDVIYMEDIYVPHFDAGQLAKAKQTIIQKAKYNDEVQSQITSLPHIFYAGEKDEIGSSNYSSPELDDIITFPVSNETSLLDFKVFLQDDMEMIDSITLGQIISQDRDEQLFASIIGNGLLIDALSKTKEERAKKQAAYKDVDAAVRQEPDHVRGHLSIAMPYGYSHGHNNTIRLALPGEPQIPNAYAMHTSYLWIECEDGAEYRAKHFFLATEKDSRGDEYIQLDKFRVRGFNLNVPISFQSYEYQERLENTMRDYYGIDMTSLEDQSDAMEDFMREHEACTELSDKEKEDANILLIKQYLYGERKHINVYRDLVNFNTFVAARVSPAAPIPAPPRGRLTTRPSPPR